MAHNNIFRLHVDRYNCITVHCEHYRSLSDMEFEQKLTVSLDFWKKIRVNCVLVNIKIDQSSLIPVCTKLGFTFHHAQPSYVLMQQWLSTEHPVSTYPKYAHHYIGTGGFVVNDKQQVLVIKEKVSHGEKMRGWKLPGGYLEVGEDFGEGAIREVREETGIESEFQHILAFRHMHKFKFGCSDIYFVCYLKAKTEDIKTCDIEIDECRWMDYAVMEGVAASATVLVPIIEDNTEHASSMSFIQEYANHPEVNDFNRFVAQQFLNGKVSINCRPMPVPWRKELTFVYIPQ